jgi:hypothetical protein
MPTPDDAILLPVMHDAITGRTTCPPDEARNVTARDVHQSHPFNVANNVEAPIDEPLQLPTPPSQEDFPAHATPSHENHTKPLSTRIETPNRDTPTPMTVVDDSADGERASQTSPVSATAPALGPTSLLSSHLSSPFPTHRVCSSAVFWRQVFELR